MGLVWLVDSIVPGNLYVQNVPSKLPKPKRHLRPSVSSPTSAIRRRWRAATTPLVRCERIYIGGPNPNWQTKTP
eukprot:s144_g26.t1